MKKHFGITVKSEVMTETFAHLGEREIYRLRLLLTIEPSIISAERGVNSIFLPKGLPVACLVIIQR
jgi:hypothetical protein